MGCKTYCSRLCSICTQIYVKSKTAQSCILDSDTVDLDLVVNLGPNYRPNLSNLWLTVSKIFEQFLPELSQILLRVYVHHAQITEELFPEL